MKPPISMPLSSCLHLVRLATVAVLVAVFSACVSLAGYDQRAYENATSLKAATIAMLRKSADENSYKENAAALDVLLVNLSAAYEYANGIEYNNEAAKNWRDLTGDDRSMIGGWVSDWQDDGEVNPILLEELTIQIAEGFDTLICLEANKRQLSACTALTGAN